MISVLVSVVVKFKALVILAGPLRFSGKFNIGKRERMRTPEGCPSGSVVMFSR